MARRHVQPALSKSDGIKTLVQIQHELFDIHSGAGIEQRMQEHSLLHEGKRIAIFEDRGCSLQLQGHMTKGWSPNRRSKSIVKNRSDIEIEPN